jgi:glutathione S-transferase
MITIWGRANSVNVQKVLWCCDELVLPYERIDAGLQFGRNNEPEYLAMNPNARVPTLVDGDFVLWESNSILRYLVMQYGSSSPLYPPEPKQRASIDRWLDWSLSTLQPAERPVFWTIVRTPVAERDRAVEARRHASARALFPRGREVHAGRHRDRRVCETLVRAGRHRASVVAESRTLVFAPRHSHGLQEVRRFPADLNGYL